MEVNGSSKNPQDGEEIQFHPQPVTRRQRLHFLVFDAGQMAIIGPNEVREQLLMKVNFRAGDETNRWYNLPRGCPYRLNRANPYRHLTGWKSSPLFFESSILSTTGNMPDAA